MTSFKELTHIFELTQEQEEQFKMYLAMLKAWNKRTNLTAITDDAEIMSHHFADSLYAGRFFDFSKVTSIADVGAGAGFPALPLKIKFPHLFTVLIEVNNKKIEFLEAVGKELGLQDIDIYAYDWRTFLRKSQYEIDVFVARASLQIPELLRLFSPASPYKKSQLLYWASQHWQPDEKEKRFFQREEWYEINNKKRKIVFFQPHQ